MEEALVNAVYHRGYDQPDPVEVRVNPEGIEVVSYPGPDASIRIEVLNGDKIVARRYRNRRIGEFLKELDLTEGRCTGIPPCARPWPATAPRRPASPRTRAAPPSSRNCQFTPTGPGSKGDMMRGMTGRVTRRRIG